MPLFLQSKVTILYAECIIQNPDIIGYRGWIGSWVGPEASRISNACSEK